AVRVGCEADGDQSDIGGARGRGEESALPRGGGGVFGALSHGHGKLCADAGAGGGAVPGASAAECGGGGGDSADGGTADTDAYADDADRGQRGSASASRRRGARGSSRQFRRT